MFESATLKLTGWYLLIIMVISLLFSILVYQSASSEIDTRLEQFERRLIFEPTFNTQNQIGNIRRLQTEAAAHNIFINLLYTNLVVLVCGGLVSYLTAKRMLEPLEKAHAAQERFVSDASHELRTPLAAMKTELEVAIKNPNLTEAEMKQLLESNLEEVDKLTKLSQTLLTLSKLEYDKLIYEHIVFNELVHTVINKYDSTGRIELHEKRNKITIDAHRSSIEELLTILIDNAFKYSPPNSKIIITITKRPSRVVFTIVNAGKGIDAKDLPHIFDRFYRADNARSRGEKTSFGLGLSLAKQIVELHDGDLTASSAPDQKTTFTISLPSLRASKAKTQQNTSAMTKFIKPKDKQ